MLETNIPKEINEYEAKFIGPFTLRQTLCLAFMAVSAYFIYKFFYPYLGRDMTGFLILIPAAIAVAFGWGHTLGITYGLKFEQYLTSIFISNFLSPQKRKYKTNNFIYDYILKTPVIEEEHADVAKKTKRKKLRYKKSKCAIK